MRKLFCKPGFLILVFAFAAFTATAQNTDELKAKIEKINKEMQKAMVSGDGSGTLVYYADDAVSMPNYGKMVQGTDAIKKSNQDMMAGGMKITSFETMTTMVSQCDNMVAEIGTYKMSATMPGVPNGIEDAGKYLTIWEQQSDGSLKIKLEMWNTDSYPMGGN
jgi:ketosteroid isomerase-like protein